MMRTDRFGVSTRMTHEDSSRQVRPRRTMYAPEPTRGYVAEGGIARGYC